MLQSTAGQTRHTLNLVTYMLKVRVIVEVLSLLPVTQTRYFSLTQGGNRQLVDGNHQPVLLGRDELRLCVVRHGAKTTTWLAANTGLFLLLMEVASSSGMAMIVMTLFFLNLASSCMSVNLTNPRLADSCSRALTTAHGAAVLLDGGPLPHHQTVTFAPFPYEPVLAGSPICS
jgi:hypothetical protein